MKPSIPTEKPTTPEPAPAPAQPVVDDSNYVKSDTLWSFPLVAAIISVLIIGICATICYFAFCRQSQKAFVLGEDGSRVTPSTKDPDVTNQNLNIVQTTENDKDDIFTGKRTPGKKIDNESHSNFRERPSDVSIKPMLRTPGLIRKNSIDTLDTFQP